MFGFQGSERPDVVARRKSDRQDAQQEWGFLANFDLSTIRTEAQLQTMVKERSGISAAQASSGVRAWMQGKDF